MVALLGPNGAGKTTMVRVLSGEWHPDTGRVHLENADLATYSDSQLARRRAVLGQDLSLAFPFTALEIVLLGRIPHERRTSMDENESIALRSMELVEADDLADRLYTSLSGGERQRVQLARVLAQIQDHTDEGNRYLLMDEPTANQDIAHQHQLLSLAKRQTGDHIGTLVVLHDLNLAAAYADRLVVLDKGIVVAEGSPENVLTKELIAGVFGIAVRVMQHPADGRPLVVVDQTPGSLKSVNSADHISKTGAA
jgi:iron complex transport system ATP-binding protein